MKKIILTLACAFSLCHALDETKSLLSGEQPPPYTDQSGGSSSSAVVVTIPPAAMAAMGDISQITADALREHALGAIDRKDRQGTVNLIQGFLQNTSSSKRNFIKALGACALAAAEDDTGFFDHMLSNMLAPDRTHPELFKYTDIFENLGAYRKDVHREYLALAANKGSTVAQRDFEQYFPQEDYATITQHPYHAPYKKLVAQRATIKAEKLWEFAEHVLRRSNSTVKKSDARIAGLAYYLLHAHPTKPYGYNLQAYMAQQGGLTKLTPQAELEIMQEYRDKFPNPISLKRHAFALEKNGELEQAFKEMRCVTYGTLFCDSQARTETKRLAQKAYSPLVCGNQDVCCCYTAVPCLCTCCCD